MSIMIAGGTVITAGDCERADMLVEGEQVAAIGRGLGAGADRVIDAAGRYVIPGGVDVHTHMELPVGGLVACDDFATGTAAAAWGGTTTIVDYAGHDRGEPLRAGLQRWRAKASGKACIDYGFHMMLSEVTDRVLAEMGDLVREGVTSFKLFMAYPDRYMVDDGQLLRAMRRAGELGALVAVHAENGAPIEVLRSELVAAGHTAPRFHAMSRPAALEAEATNRSIVLAELAGVPVYIAHLSSAAALAAVRAARDAGAAVHAETCPQYLYLSDCELAREGLAGAEFVCSPPLRQAGDPPQLWRGLRLGDLDVVATDHCPFTLAQKALGLDDFTKIPNGLHGVEERLTLLFEGVHRGEIGLTRWVDIAATMPARLFGLYPRKGTLQPGADADIVIFDPGAERTMSAATHHSSVDYSCYEGMRVHGRPDIVMQRGRILVKDGKFSGVRGAGRFLPRNLPDWPAAGRGQGPVQPAQSARLCRPEAPRQARSALDAREQDGDPVAGADNA